MGAPILPSEATTEDANEAPRAGGNDARTVFGGEPMTPSSRKALLYFWLTLATLAIGGVTVMRWQFGSARPSTATNAPTR